ncbi:MAG: TlpA family protein disulfide reductase [Deltaproteobacteria bacterium]|nr:TlpA family protein disulfide reductase [Deltaproteobacteria bacterium]
MVELRVRASRASRYLAAVLGIAACQPGPASVEAPTPLVPSGRLVRFELPRADGGMLQSDELLGRATLVVVAATYDTASQAAVSIAGAVVRRHKPRANGLLVVLEPEQNRPLVQAFVGAMDLPFPTALADADTLAAEGVFDGLRHVPSFVILDREGRECWRRVGLVKAEVLEDALREVPGE